MCDSMMPIDCARCGSSKCSSFVLWFADASADALAALPDARARYTLHLAFAIGYARVLAGHELYGARVRGACAIASAA
jgi:hypothetical protein